jgi:hypothetical protein
MTKEDKVMRGGHCVCVGGGGVVKATQAVVQLFVVHLFTRPTWLDAISLSFFHTITTIWWCPRAKVSQLELHSNPFTRTSSQNRYNCEPTCWVHCQRTTWNWPARQEGNTFFGLCSGLGALAPSVALSNALCCLVPQNLKSQVPNTVTVGIDLHCGSRLRQIIEFEHLTQCPHSHHWSHVS